jgi:adenylylsulfate kinase-like enzyme
VVAGPIAVHDTSLEAAAPQTKIHLAMSGAGKVLIAYQMTNAVRAMAITKEANPALDGAGIRDQLRGLHGFRRQR